MSRNRLTWRRASEHPATPWEGHTHPASYEDPVEDAYGIDSDFGEDVHEGPYVNGMPPASQGWVSDHPASRRQLERKASRCIQIAQSMLGKTASARAIEDQALALMDMSENEVNRTLSRVASSFMVAEDMEAHDLFDQYDTNGEGMIYQDDFGGTDEVFDALDMNDDGYLTPEEVAMGLGDSFSDYDESDESDEIIDDMDDVEEELDYLEDEVDALEDEMGLTAEDIEADRKWGHKGNVGVKFPKGYYSAPKARKGIKKALKPWVRGGANKILKRYNKQYRAQYWDANKKKILTKGRTRLRRKASEEMATYMDLPQNHAHAFYSDEHELENEMSRIAEELEACGMYAEDMEADMFAEDEDDDHEANEMLAEMLAELEDMEAEDMEAEDMEADMFAEDMEAEDMEACGTYAEDTDLNASLDPMAEDTMGLNAEDMEADDDTLASLFKAASDDEDEEGEEDEDEDDEDEDESKSSSKKASLKPQARKSSAGVKSLGSISKSASSEVNDLAKLWESAPDVKDFF